MKLEELTKQQIILLTLLVSFVTSIATGIVTVTLLGQTPPGTTQTVNRILERTVEKIVPDKQGASVVTSEKTVVVKEEDLITKSIENGTKSIVRIYEKIETGNKDENKFGTFMGIGVIVSKDGRIVSDGSFFDKQKNYIVSTYDNRNFVVENKTKDGSAIFIADVIEGKDKENYVFNPVSFSDSKNLKLGQTVIAIGGEKRDSVTEGIISSVLQESVVVKEGVDKTSGKEEIKEITKTKTSEIQTSIQSIEIIGVPLFNLFGEVIGINIILKGEFMIIPSDYIVEQLNLIKSVDIKEPVKK